MATVLDLLKAAVAKRDAALGQLEARKADWSDDYLERKQAEVLEAFDADVRAVDDRAATLRKGLEGRVQQGYQNLIHKPLEAAAETRRASAIRRFELLAEVGTPEELESEVRQAIARGDSPTIRAARDVSTLLARKRASDGTLGPHDRATWATAGERIAGALSDHVRSIRPVELSKDEADLAALDAELAEASPYRRSDHGLRRLAGHPRIGASH